EALDVTRDGTKILGSAGGPDFGAYIYHTGNGQLDILGAEPFRSIAYRGNDAADVVGGFDDSEVGRTFSIWTPQLAWYDQNLFLNGQGAYIQDVSNLGLLAMSADGTVWAGVGASIVYNFAQIPWRVEIPKVVICHKSPGGNNATAKNLDVTFPGGLGE